MRLLLLLLCILISCNDKVQESGKQQPITKKNRPKPGFLEIAHQESVNNIDYAVYYEDSLVNEPYVQSPSLYDTFPGIGTFRGGPFRDMPLTGILDSMPTSFSIDWTF
ncbi:MAG: hypothetical protein ACKO2H_06310, partial [Bacteroidota bacterium]